MGKMIAPKSFLGFIWQLLLDFNICFEQKMLINYAITSVSQIGLKTLNETQELANYPEVSVANQNESE